MLRPLLALCTFFGVVSAYSQPGRKYDIADADEHYQHNNFQMALPVYKELMKTDKNNADIPYKIGQCYLNTNINKPEAARYFEICTKNPKGSPEAWYYLGIAYRLGNKIDEAIKAFEKYNELEPKKKKITERQI